MSVTREKTDPAMEDAPARGRKAGIARDVAAGYAFLSPWLVGFLLLTAFPMVASLYLAFTDYDLFRPPQWVGLENFQALFDGGIVDRIQQLVGLPAGGWVGDP
jgi:multiple sugar transport system permease protein